MPIRALVWFDNFHKIHIRAVRVSSFMGAIGMPSAGSITHWIRDVRRGDSAAAEGLWKRYFPKLVQLARKNFRVCPAKWLTRKTLRSVP